MDSVPITDGLKHIKRSREVLNPLCELKTTAIESFVNHITECSNVATRLI